MDSQGQFMRRIKTITLPIPCITGQQDVLQLPDGGLLQLFKINHEFANEWQLFKLAANNNERKLRPSVDKSNFPYWTKSLGLDDTITATFCSIDF